MLIQNHLNTIDNFTEESIKEMFIKISAFNKEKEIQEKCCENDCSKKGTEMVKINNNDNNELLISKNKTLINPKINKLSLIETSYSSNQILSSDKNITKINENLYHNVKNEKKKAKFQGQKERIVKNKFCSSKLNRINYLPQINELEKEDDTIINKKDNNCTKTINYEGNNINNNIRKSSTKKKEMQNNNQTEK